MSLWQKPDSERPVPRPSTGVPQSAGPITERENRMDRLVNIGQSIEIRGELTGNEDLTIDGRIEGKIILKDHHLTIGANGRIKAEIQAKSVLVHGEVIGNVTADDRVEIAPTGSVQGDLCAPRVALADGSTFKGSIDMGRKPVINKGGAGSTMGAQDMPRAVAASKA